MFSGMRQPLPVVALLLLWLAALACTLPGATTPRPATPAPAPLPIASATPDTSPLAGTPLAALPTVSPPDFAPFRLTPAPVPATAAAYPLRLDRVENEMALRHLSRVEREMLGERGFVAVASPYDSFGELYQAATEDGFPLLLTADVALYTLDVIAGVAWQRAEVRLVPHLQALSEEMAAATLAEWEGAADATLAAAAWANLAYFSIGSRLLNPDFAVPGAVATIVEEELTLIGQGGTFISPLRGVQLDYGRLQPQGRYANTPELAGFFRARHWYGLPFVLDGEQPGRTRQETRQLALMALALDESSNLSRWGRVYEPLAFFENATASNSMAEVRVALDALGGPAALEQDRLDDLAATLLAGPETPAEEAPPARSFTFLPPAMSLAETVLPAFVFNRVGNYLGDPDEQPLPVTAVETNIGPIRGLPRVLDVAAALGSDEALAWLAAGGDSAYQGYDSQLAAMQERLQVMQPGSFATGWLYTMMPLLEPPRAALRYATDEAWAQRRLNSWLGGWILQHDGAQLDSRPVDHQPAASAPLPGFVEADPALFASLAALTSQVEEGLRGRDLLDEEAGQKLLQLERLYRAWEEVAVAALAAERLDEDALLLLTQLAARLEALLTFAPPAGGVPRIAPALPRQATTYTEPSSGTRMLAHLADAWPLYVLVARDGELWVAAGAIFPAYELRDEAGAGGAAGSVDATLPLSPWLEPLLAATPSS
ncbi:MAG: DUF3160 domain-containing protein [Anaerolineae bacterium]|nr:DUF3160 domain-containing protein [Anaerolineae bacterium]